MLLPRAFGCHVRNALAAFGSASYEDLWTYLAQWNEFPVVLFPNPADPNPHVIDGWIDALDPAHAFTTSSQAMGLLVAEVTERMKPLLEEQVGCGTVPLVARPA